MKISIIEPLQLDKEIVLDKFSEIDADIDYYEDKPDNKDEKIKRCEDSEIIVLVDEEIDSEVMDKLEYLQLIAVSFTGYDHIDIDIAEKNDIAVVNVPEYATTAVAELVFGFAINLLRDIRIGDMVVRSKRDVNRKDIKGNELSGKTLGIIGTGNIGSKVAEFGKLFGMKVFAYSRSKNTKITDFVDYKDMDEVFKESDLVSLNIPLTDETEGIVGEDELSIMKEGSVLINTARAGVIDKHAFINNVKKGKIQFGIDIPHEDLPEDVLKSDNVVYTPHVGYYTEEALKRRLEVTVNNIDKFLEGDEENRIV